ncbi:MAG: DUF4143 domain-containing protein, partial [Spirochaetales bacterium]|nr:DUF4143 domain-containing protein [Spirochaetales bacterium]
NTLSGYFEILEDTLLAFRLPAYEAKLRIRERKHPKLYWVDPGLARAAAGRHGEPHPEERGVLFEGLIASVLRACRNYLGSFDEFYYWASATGRSVEVDFLLARGNEFTAIEVKGAQAHGEPSARAARLPRSAGAEEENPGLPGRTHPEDRPRNRCMAVSPSRRESHRGAPLGPSITWPAAASAPAAARSPCCARRG